MFWLARSAKYLAKVASGMVQADRNGNQTFGPRGSKNLQDYAKPSSGGGARFARALAPGVCRGLLHVSHTVCPWPTACSYILETTAF